MVVIDGEEAIKSYKEKSPHILLMDINMPKMDGVAALKAIMHINPKACVIMLTSQNIDGCCKKMS